MFAIGEFQSVADLDVSGAAPGADKRIRKEMVLVVLAAPLQGTFFGLSVLIQQLGMIHNAYRL